MKRGSREEREREREKYEIGGWYGDREVGADVISLLAVALGKEIMEHRDNTSRTNVNRVRDYIGFAGIGTRENYDLSCDEQRDSGK